MSVANDSRLLNQSLPLQLLATRCPVIAPKDFFPTILYSHDFWVVSGDFSLSEESIYEEIA